MLFVTFFCDLLWYFVQVPEAAPTQLRPDVQEEQNPRVRDRSGKKHTKIIHIYFRKPLFDNRTFIPEVNFALTDGVQALDLLL
jgi:hypothetical protein